MKIGKALQNFIQVGPGLSFLPSLLLPSFLAPRSAVRHSALGRPVFHGTRERWADPLNPGIKSIFTPIPFLMSLNWTKYDSLPDFPETAPLSSWLFSTGVRWCVHSISECDFKPPPFPRIAPNFSDSEKSECCRVSGCRRSAGHTVRVA